MSSPSRALTKTFPLDPAVLGPGSALTLDVGGSTDADVLQAILSNKAFPTRPNGVIDLAHISLTATGNPVVFQGGQVPLTVGFSAGVTAGVGIFDDPSAAVGSLGLDETPGLDLGFGATPAGFRFAMLRAGYQASGSVSGSHPIGMVGSFTFGATAAANGVSAVIHRFASSEGAASVLEATIKSWKLPRHLSSPDKLAPATWIVTEAEGSLAVKLAAQLGYNFNFVREAKVLGLSGDIGLKLDAAATATFGIDVSGRYVVVVGRESEDPGKQAVRLRLFKLASHGVQFGLNLKVAVTGVETLTPDSVDDFVKAVFGVHGAQVVNALAQIEKWTNPSQSVGQLVAGLTNEKGLELLKKVTGVDPATAFDAARGKLLQAINLYQGLPARASSELLKLLNKLDSTAASALQSSLQLLASTDETVQKNALTQLLSSVGFANSPIGTLLSGLADKGLLHLLDSLPALRSAANSILSILNGDVIAKLQKYIDEELGLDKILSVVQEADFNRLDSYLVGRLAAFFDKELHFSDLNEIKNTINLVISKRREIYDKARNALNSTYGVNVAATWEGTSASTALVDVVFDLANPQTRSLFQSVVEGASAALDQLFTTKIAGVQINYAVLSHELSRKSTLEVSLPKFNFQTQTVTTALANVHPEDDSGGRLLVYDATGSNVVSVRNRFTSSLSITIASIVAAGGSASAFPDLRIHSTDQNTWAYKLAYVKENLKREELEALTRPFIMRFMPEKFSQGMSLSTWYNELESTSEGILHNGPEVYGDTCASFEVTVPGETLSAWTQRFANAAAIAKQASVAIQKSLKTNLPLFYLSDIGKLRNLASSAPLLVWASIPPTASFNGSQFSTTEGNDVFWDHVDPKLRLSAAQHPLTASNLRLMLPQLRLRLEEAGMHDTTQFYEDNQVGNIISSATTSFGDNLLEKLLLFESSVAFKAEEAIKDVQEFLGSASTAPGMAVDRLAEFAADVVTAFNKLVGNNVFANLASFRAVAQVVFAEASSAIGASPVVQPRALLTLDILEPASTRKFNLADFLNGSLPASDDIAVEQRLLTS